MPIFPSTCYAWFTRVYRLLRPSSSSLPFTSFPHSFLSQSVENISQICSSDVAETIGHLEKTLSSSITGGGGGTSGGRPGRPVDLPRPKTRMDSPSNTNNVHQIVKAQIVFLLSTLTEENFEQNQLQIRSVSVLNFTHFFLSVVCCSAMPLHDEQMGFGLHLPSTTHMSPKDLY